MYAYSRVEKAAANPEKDPNVNSQRGSEGRRYEEKVYSVWTIAIHRNCRRNLDCCEAHEEEGECAAEFSNKGDDLISYPVRNEGQPLKLTIRLFFAAGRFL